MSRRRAARALKPLYAKGLTGKGKKAGPGYDMASGLGTVDALRFTHALASR